MENLESLFLKRQSTREFSKEPVTDKQLEEICRLSQLAPSAINAQPYRMYAVAGEKAKQFVKNIQIGGANGWADTATAFIVIEQLAPTEIKRDTRTISNAPFIENDIGILAAFIALAAEDVGVQNCIVGLRDEKAIAQFLSLPEDTRFPLIIALGHAAEGYTVRRKMRKPFEEKFKLIK